VVSLGKVIKPLVLYTTKYPAGVGDIFEKLPLILLVVIFVKFKVATDVLGAIHAVPNVEVSSLFTLLMITILYLFPNPEQKLYGNTAK
jgi:hypothetical protein